MGKSTVVILTGFTVVVAVAFALAVPRMLNDVELVNDAACAASVANPGCDVFIFNYSRRADSVYVDCDGHVGRSIRTGRIKRIYRDGKIVE